MIIRGHTTDSVFAEHIIDKHTVTNNSRHRKANLELVQSRFQININLKNQMKSYRGQTFPPEVRITSVTPVESKSIPITPVTALVVVVQEAVYA